LQQSDPENWLADIDHDLISNNDGDFKHWLDRYKYADRHPEQSAEFYRQQGEKTLLFLEQRLMNTPYLSGENISVTDIAIFPFIRQFSSVDFAWFETAPYPKLQAWLQILIDSVLFEKTMVKYQPWEADGIVAVFP
jgi:glutathione S-transferase